MAGAAQAGDLIENTSLCQIEECSSSDNEVSVTDDFAGVLARGVNEPTVTNYYAGGLLGYTGTKSLLINNYSISQAEARTGEAFGSEFVGRANSLLGVLYRYLAMKRWCLEVYKRGISKIN